MTSLIEYLVHKQFGVSVDHIDVIKENDHLEITFPENIPQNQLNINNNSDLVLNVNKKSLYNIPKTVLLKNIDNLDNCTENSNQTPELIQDLLLTTFDNRNEMTKHLKAMTNENGFDLYIPYGEKSLISGQKKTVYLCGYKSNPEKTIERGTCPFYLQFMTEIPERNTFCILM